MIWLLRNLRAGCLIMVALGIVAFAIGWGAGEMKNEGKLFNKYETVSDAVLVEMLLQARVCHCVCPEERALRAAAASRILGKRIKQLAHAGCGALLQNKDGALYCAKCELTITDDAQIEQLDV